MTFSYFFLLKHLQTVSVAVAQQGTTNVKEQKEPTVLPSQDADCHNGGVKCGENEECVRGNNNAYHVS